MTATDEKPIESSPHDTIPAIVAAIPEMTVQAYIAAHAPFTIDDALAARGWDREYLKSEHGRRIVIEQLAIMRGQYARQLVAKLKRDEAA